MKRRQPGLSLIERALVERDWHQIAVTAQIQALYGDNSEGMVDAAGRVMYVVLGAVMAEGVSHEQPEVRIIRGAVNAVHDQVGEEAIPAARRRSIVSGLQACERLIPALERRSLINAACDLKLRMKTQHIHLSDFLALIPASPSTLGAPAA